MNSSPLLGPGDPAPLELLAGHGTSPWLLVADHAGQAVPAALGRLGLSQAQLDRHIGWDIGIAGVTQELSRLLDATAVLQTYSRLVIDCNRPLHVPGSIVESSDGTLVPGNRMLPLAARQQRQQAIFTPYHAAIAAQLDRRQAQGRPTLLAAMHSFTPVYKGIQRPWHCGVLYNRDARLAHALGQALLAEGDLHVGDNQPYTVSDLSDYAINVHGAARGLVHVELEIRQDLITERAGQHAWAVRLARLFGALQSRFTPA